MAVEIKCLTCPTHKKWFTSSHPKNGYSDPILPILGKPDTIRQAVNRPTVFEGKTLNTTAFFLSLNQLQFRLQPPREPNMLT